MHMQWTMFHPTPCLQRTCVYYPLKYTYTCTAPPPPVECQTIQEILDDGSCHCSCIEFEIPQGKMPRGGPEKDECPVCNETCNAEMPDEGSAVSQVSVDPLVIHTSSCSACLVIVFINTF